MLFLKQFPDYDGELQTTLLQQRSRALAQSANAMQVIHIHERRHCAVISPIGCDNSTVKYYDSFPGIFLYKLSKQLLAF